MLSIHIIFISLTHLSFLWWLGTNLLSEVTSVFNHFGDYLADIGVLWLSHKVGDKSVFLAKSTNSADSMEVVEGGLGEVVLNHMVNIQGIESSGC